MQELHQSAFTGQDSQAVTPCCLVPQQMLGSLRGADTVNVCCSAGVSTQKALPAFLFGRWPGAQQIGSC